MTFDVSLKTLLASYLFFFTLIFSSPLLADDSKESAAPPKDSIQEMYENLQRTSVKMKEVYKHLSGPRIEKLTDLLTDKSFTDPLEKKFKTFDFKEFTLVNVSFLILFIGFKAWILSRRRKWYSKLLCSLFMNVIYLISSLIAIPYYYLGEPYMKILRTFFEILFLTPAT
ncbi:hypothetical protein OAQ84_00985 [Bdellovibrionales bacterium]|nr:hypothetical protein [Bdellovibrionales bacterium]